VIARRRSTSPSQRSLVIIPTFNELENLPLILGRVHKARPDVHVLIVDDGSSDGTSQIADELAATLPCVRAHHHGVNQGLGAVYRSGFAQARGDLLTFFPADGQFPATIIGLYLDAIADTDMILGTLPNRRGSLVAKALSLAERLLLRALFGHFPRFQGILMFRRSLLDGTTRGGDVQFFQLDAGGEFLQAQFQAGALDFELDFFGGKFFEPDDVALLLQIQRGDLIAHAGQVLRGGECVRLCLPQGFLLPAQFLLDLAQRAGMKGIQEWLSFYFKGPMTAPGLYPEHDIFIQLMKLKNTLRWMRGEDLITHLGLEYYD